MGTALGQVASLPNPEALPLAEHHADRALTRLLGDGMLRFRLTRAASDWHRPAMELALTEAGLPVEWAVLPMVPTGWDAAYYGPGRRAGAWAMDLPTALSLGLDIRRGWDERHVPERMHRLPVWWIAQVRNQHPDSPLRQVLPWSGAGMQEAPSRRTLWTRTFSVGCICFAS